MIRVVFNQKGGVGKSTIAVNLAAIGAMRGRRTLMIDLDPQANATSYLLGLPGDEGSAKAAVSDGHTVGDFFEQSLSFRLDALKLDQCIRKTPFARLGIVPGDTGLSDLQSKLEARAKILKLPQALRELKGWDDIVIDTPPALNFFTRSALIGADACLIPFDCDEFARQALYGLLESVGEIGADHNPKLRIEGIVANQFNPRSSLPVRIVEALVDEGLPVLQTRLSSSVKVRESHEACLPLPHFAPGHKLTLEFMALYEELDARNRG